MLVPRNTDTGVWFLRVYHGVRIHLPTRWLEWLMSLYIIVWGYTFLGSDVQPTGAWHGLLFWASAPVWGWSMIALGLIRLVALAVNGTFHNTIYSRYSPLVRGASAGLCGIAWFAVSVSALSAGALGGVTYSLVFLIESFISYFVLGEAGDNSRNYRNGN